MSKDDHTAALVEVFDGKLDLILEILKPLQEDVASLKIRAEKIEGDVKIIKAAVTDTSKQVHAHERLLAKLKPAQ